MFCWDIPLENKFKWCVYLDTHGNDSGSSVYDIGKKYQQRDEFTIPSHPTQKRSNDIYV